MQHIAVNSLNQKAARTLEKTGNVGTLEGQANMMAGTAKQMIISDVG